MGTVPVSDDTFSSLVLGAPLPVLVDFWGPACGPCIMLAPILEELADEYTNRLTIATLDVSQNPQTTASYGIVSIPTMNIYLGGQIATSFIGGRPKRFLIQEIDNVLGALPPS